jgi:hypothetical protein
MEDGGLVVDTGGPSFARPVAHFHLRPLPTPPLRAHYDVIVDSGMVSVVDIRLFTNHRQVMMIGTGRSRKDEHSLRRVTYLFVFMNRPPVPSTSLQMFKAETLLAVDTLLPLGHRWSACSAPCLLNRALDHQTTHHRWHPDTALSFLSVLSVLCLVEQVGAALRVAYDGTARLTSLTLTPCCITNQLSNASAQHPRVY